MWKKKQQLQQVFLILFQNAREAVLEEKNSGVINIVSLPEGEDIKIKVRDNGPGISEEIKDRIFDPFFSSKENGTGLGLAISREIMGEHNGDIAVNKTDVGTEFILILPTLQEGGTGT